MDDYWGGLYMPLVARLRPGVTLAQAGPKRVPSWIASAPRFPFPCRAITTVTSPPSRSTPTWSAISRGNSSSCSLGRHRARHCLSPTSPACSSRVPRDGPQYERCASPSAPDACASCVNCSPRAFCWPPWLRSRPGDRRGGALRLQIRPTAGDALASAASHLLAGGRFRRRAPSSRDSPSAWHPL